MRIRVLSQLRHCSCQRAVHESHARGTLLRRSLGSDSRGPPSVRLEALENESGVGGGVGASPTPYIRLILCGLTNLPILDSFSLQNWGMRVVHSGQSTCHVISVRGD